MPESTKLLFDPVPPEPKREQFADVWSYSAAIIAWLKECARVANAQAERMATTR